MNHNVCVNNPLFWKNCTTKKLLRLIILLFVTPFHLHTIMQATLNIECGTYSLFPWVRDI